MDVFDADSLPDDPETLKKLILEQQRLLQQNQGHLTRQKTRIEILEEQLQQLRKHRFGQRSEKLNNAAQYQLFNEAEIIADDEADEANRAESDESLVQVPPHTRRRKARKPIPAELDRVDVVHDLAADQRSCSDCGAELRLIGEDVSEQLCVIPQQLFVLRHRRQKYACTCKQCLRTAPIPEQPLPGSQASPRLLADIMVRKYLDGLPLYRQEKIAARDGLDLPRDKLARWVIGGSELFIPILNLLEDAFFSYDIAQSDDTSLRVLKEDGRLARSQSALWIRRGGPPNQPVVLVDYEISKSGRTAYRLLSEFRGYLVSDGADSFNLAVRTNELVPALCNDHARRRFRRALDGIDKVCAKGSIARKALDYYGKLYRIEADTRTLDPQQRHHERQVRAVPIWQQFIAWAQAVFSEGVAHGKTTEALSYLLKHRQALQNYCTDGRLPISNILAEHVAKTIAISRKYLNCRIMQSDVGTTS